MDVEEAQWLKLFDPRLRSYKFELYRRHCVVFMSKTHKPFLSTGLT